MVTLYTTMSDDAIRHGIEQTEAPVIFTDQDLMPRLTSVLKGIALIRGETKVRFIVYFENSHEETFERPKVAGVTVYPYSDLRTVGVDTTSACQARMTTLLLLFLPLLHSTIGRMEY